MKKPAHHITKGAGPKAPMPPVSTGKGKPMPMAHTSMPHAMKGKPRSKGK